MKIKLVTILLLIKFIYANLENSVDKPSNRNCANFPANYFECDFNLTCVYGSIIQTNCKIKKFIPCKGNREIIVNHTCAYCYQLPISNYTCSLPTTCKAYDRYLSNCKVNNKVFCLGNRNFKKFKKCHIVSNVKWNYAILLSLTLGGFGLDHFYLGNSWIGLGKMLSFGGLGIWTLIDIILIWLGYLKPLDGCIYS